MVAQHGQGTSNIVCWQKWLNLVCLGFLKALVLRANKDDGIVHHKVQAILCAGRSDSI